MTKRLNWRVRQLGWVFAFLGVLASLVFPMIILSAQANHALSIYEQGLLILLATFVNQRLRKETISEVIGKVAVPTWLRQFTLGCAIGALLMLVPAAFLVLSGQVVFEPTGTGWDTLLAGIASMIGAAIAEELLFRGVLFLRLIAAVGTWPAQFLIAGLFTLTHLGNPGMTGDAKLWASANIFLASIMIGLTYLKTSSLAMPIGLHFMANATQGSVLGFGVSGQSEVGLFAPAFSSSTTWMTGGEFGLEASVPGLVAVAATTIWLVASSRRRGSVALKYSTAKLER